MEIGVALLILFVMGFLAFEYRFRRPDHIILFESRAGISTRRGRLYPRHFSLPLSKSTCSFTQTMETSAKGNLDVRVKLAVTVAPSTDDIPALLRAGGWSPDAVTKAAGELETVLLGMVKEFTEVREIEELTSAGIRDSIRQSLPEFRRNLGLDVIALTIAATEPVNPQIAEAMRQREQARILEQTETLNQQARVAASRAKMKADEEIARLENDLALKRYALKKTEYEKEAALARQRAEEELRVKKMNLEFEREELRLLKDNPELLLLTPQAARLAEASQAMKNARTVVSLSPTDSSQGSELLGMFHTLLRKAVDGIKHRTEK